jgi:hypothetical protein
VILKPPKNLLKNALHPPGGFFKKPFAAPNAVLVKSFNTTTIFI